MIIKNKNHITNFNQLNKDLTNIYSDNNKNNDDDYETETDLLNNELKK